MNKLIFKYVFFDLARSRFIITYTAALALISAGVVMFSNDEVKTVLTMLNITLFIIPLVCLIFGSVHFYDSEEFTEFLLTQPVSRSSVFASVYASLSAALSLAAISGLAPALIFYGLSPNITMLLITSVILTLIFTGLSYLSASINIEKVRGIGFSIIIWLFAAVFFDLFIILLLIFFRDYPLENFIIVLTSANPIDLSRILLLLKTDMSAMMGFTGASFKKFFGSGAGMAVCAGILILWTVVPFVVALRIFRRRNF